MSAVATHARMAVSPPPTRTTRSRWVITPELSTGLVVGLVAAAPPERSGSVVVVDTGFLMQGVTVDLSNYIPSAWTSRIAGRFRDADDPQV